MANYVDYRTGEARMAPYRARRTKKQLRRFNDFISRNTNNMDFDPLIDGVCAICIVLIPILGIAIFVKHAL